MKKILLIILIVAVALVVLAVSKDQMLKNAITTVGSQITGARINMKGFSWGILRQSVKITGLKIQNPKGFSNAVLIDLPKAAVGYDLLSLLKGKTHLKFVDIELKELLLEKNKDGQLNVDSLKVAQTKEEKKPAKARELQIDELNLMIGKVIYKDYSRGEPPVVQVHDINLTRSYKNITSAEQLTALILAAPLQAAGIKGVGIYGAAALTGIALLPMAAGVTIFGKDHVQEDVNAPLDALYNLSLSILKNAGKVTKEDRTNSVISAEVSGASVALKLKQISSRVTQITISARKALLPKPEIAAGILYQIKEKVK